MKRLYKYLIVLTTGALLGSCTYDFPESAPPSSGAANFTKMISVGNSLTAGFMDGALYNDGQANSFPSIIAQQMQSVGGGVFNQPDINSFNGYNSSVSNPGAGVILGRFVLASQGGASPAPTPSGALGGLPAPYNTADLPTAYTGDKSALNNFGVPGITLGLALTPLTGTPGDPLENGLYTRFASAPGTSTVIGDAAAALADGGTFFTFWLGSNDVLGYALGGASNETILTDATQFESLFNTALGAMLTAQPAATGAVANVPDVTSIPYFSLVPWNSIPMDAATAAGTNAAFASYNGGLAAALSNSIITQAEYDRRVIEYVEGSNGFLIDDPELTDVATASGGAIPIPNYRLTEDTDLIPLTAASILGTLANPSDPTSVYGVGVALGDAYALTPAELTIVQNRTNAFNSSIADAVAANADRLVLIDVNSILKDLVTLGASINGSGLNSTIFPPFGAFSADGVHPNQRGYAYVANKWIEAINSKFSSNIPEVNPNDHVGNNLPIVY